MTLSGRVDTLEIQLSYVLQDLLRVPNLDTLSLLSKTWNQEFNNLENTILQNGADLQELQVLYANLALDIRGAIDDVGSGIVQKTFETVSKNLSQYPYQLYYNSGEDLTGITYSVGATGYINKGLEYNASGLLTRVTLSGSPPLDITLNKQLLYSGSTLTGAFYY